MQEYQLYVGGEFCPAKSGKAIDSINPATEEPWARAARAVAPLGKGGRL